MFVMYAGSFGLNDALVKQGSIAFGKGEPEGTQELYGLAVLYSTFGVFIIASTTLVFAFLYAEDASVKQAFILMGILAFGTLEFNLVNSYLRVNHKFVTLSFMLFIKSGLVVLLAWYFAPRFGVNGVVILETAIFLLLAGTVLYFNRPNFDFKKILKGHVFFKKTIKHGMPIMVASVIRNLTLNLDRWVMIGSLGVIALAKYAFAMIFYQAGMVGISFISTILGTRWLADYGRDASLDAMISKITQIMVVGSITALLVAWPVLTLISYVVELHYENYAGEDFNLTMVFIYFGVVFLTLSSLVDWLFIASSNEKILLKISLYSLAITIFLMVYCYLEAEKIYIYALVFLAVRVFNFTFSLICISRLLATKTVKNSV